MNVQRAQQILRSKDKIDVELNGMPVWIESIDAGSGTAQVHLENNPAVVQTVPVDQLQEAQ